MIPFETIWARIVAHQTETFRQIRGGTFNYLVRGSSVVLSRTNHNIHRGDFEKAAGMLPLANTRPVQHLRGPSYIYAILMDPRIRGTDS